MCHGAGAFGAGPVVDDLGGSHCLTACIRPQNTAKHGDFASAEIIFASPYSPLVDAPS